MPDDDRTYLRAISLELEEETGYDSIPTIERTYLDLDERDVYECPFPDCSLVRRDSVAMWKHVHFSRKHGLSFGRSLEHLIAERIEQAQT